MNQIDRSELLSNISSIRREAKALLADPAGGGHAARLRRILMILAYMREHLEMVAVAHTNDERKESSRAAAPSAGVDGTRQVTDSS